MPSAAVRKEEWAEVVFDAFAVLRAHMADPDTAAALRAAGEVMKLEIARMRHGTAISGTAEPVADADDHRVAARPGMAGLFAPVPADADADELALIAEIDREMLAEMGPAAPDRAPVTG